MVCRVLQKHIQKYLNGFMQNGFLELHFEPPTTNTFLLTEVLTN